MHTVLLILSAGEKQISDIYKCPVRTKIPTFEKHPNPIVFYQITSLIKIRN